MGLDLTISCYGVFLGGVDRGSFGWKDTPNPRGRTGVAWSILKAAPSNINLSGLTRLYHLFFYMLSSKQL